MVKALMEDAQVDVESRNENNETPLHLAMHHPRSSPIKTTERVEMIQSLLEAGANPNSIDRRGDSPFDLARQRGFEDFAQLLSNALDGVLLDDSTGSEWEG